MLISQMMSFLVLGWSIIVESNHNIGQLQSALLRQRRRTKNV